MQKKCRDEQLGRPMVFYARYIMHLTPCNGARQSLTVLNRQSHQSGPFCIILRANIYDQDFSLLSASLIQLKSDFFVFEIYVKLWMESIFDRRKSGTQIIAEKKN